MKNFKLGNRPRDRKDSSRRSFSGRDSRRPLLYDAVCDECGKDCQVPIKPSGEKPVYCSDCFEKKGGRDSSRLRDRKDSSRRRPLLYDAVCDECGKDCQVPFKPSGEKPVYCSDCFEKKGGRDSSRLRDRKDSSRRGFGGRDSRRPLQNNISDRSISRLIEKIEILNTKLDTIINLLSLAGKKKSELVEGRTKKNKKSKNTKADETTEALTLFEKKDTDLTADNVQENIKSKPKKRVKTKVDSQSKTKSKVEEKPKKPITKS